MRKTHISLLASAIVVAGVAVSASVFAQGNWQLPEGAAAEKSPLKPGPAVLKQGRGLFVANCQKCHGAEGKGDGPDSDPRMPAADLTDGFRAELNPDGVLYYRIWNGKEPVMPAFKNTLKNDQVWQVVEYIKSIRK
jgi:mono/diheme cytochrome c family protein